MMEQSLQRVENELKALKASLPVAGSLVETYCMTQKFTKTIQNGANWQYTITFTPFPGYGKIAINTMSVYCEDWASGPYTSQYNPYSYVSANNPTQANNGVMVFTRKGKTTFYDGDDYEKRLTVTVYGTIPGTLSIAWS